MIRIEDAALERSALTGEMDIAIPVEVYLPADGEPEITTFALCEDIVREYAARFAEDLLGESAIAWLSAQVTAQIADYGYTYAPDPSTVIAEYQARNPAPMQSSGSVIRLDVAENRHEYRNETSVEFDFTDDVDDPVFAAVENNAIVSCACINDADYANGALELYVETAQAHRNRGYGKMCVAALTNHLLQQGKIIWYKCYEGNYASVAVAKGCGLALAGRRAALVCYANA